MAQSILVTGSNSGFGRLTVKTLAKDGHTVLASMRNVHGKNAEAAKKLHAWAQEEGLALHVVELDVTNAGSVAEAVKQVLNIAGRIDVVVNNAGLAIVGISEGFTLDQIHALFEVNVFGMLRVNKAVLPYMRKQGSGLLIHLSSAFGRFPMPFSALYSASKFAIEGFAEAYRYELLPLGIDSVIIEPGPFPTEHGAKIVFPADRQTVKEYEEFADKSQKIGETLGSFFSSPESPNPQDVADAVKGLIEMPHGERPLRTVVDSLSGELIEAINAVSVKNQPEFMRRYGRDR